MWCYSEEEGSLVLFGVFFCVLEARQWLIIEDLVNPSNLITSKFSCFFKCKVSSSFSCWVWKHTVYEVPIPLSYSACLHSVISTGELGWLLAVPRGHHRSKSEEHFWLSNQFWAWGRAGNGRCAASFIMRSRTFKGIFNLLQLLLLRFFSFVIVVTVLTSVLEVGCRGSNFKGIT